MPALHPFTTSSTLYTFDLFTLGIKQNTYYTKITMRLFTSIVNTKDIPYTLPTLKKILPSILRAECFNDKKLPFFKEVRKTEIGHLFEHILLEYLCISKISLGIQSACFEGHTHWNWEVEPKGTFHIYINTGYKDGEIFFGALKKSVELLSIILRDYQLVTASSFA